MSKFPDNFFWGAAASSHQVEGGNFNDWSEWEKENAERLAEAAKEKSWPDYILNAKPSPLNAENYISGRARGHYGRFEEDFDIAKSLSHNAHRFSIEWSRIEPEEGKWNEKEIEHYRRVVRALRERGIEPFATLWHWSLPLWLAKKGGAGAKNFPDYFRRYAEKIVSSLKNDVKFWMTLNEPEIYAVNSYLKGVWPPQKRNLFAYLKVLRNLIKAHRNAFGVIKKIQPAARIGIAKNNVFFEGWLASLAGWWWNFYFLNKIADKQDFIGLNYYFHNRIKGLKFNQNPVPDASRRYGAGPEADISHRYEVSPRVSDLGWELYPEGIYYVLKDLARYKKPIYITENGLADAQDKNREWFIKETLKNVHRAISEGTDVRGYFYWSLLDNFEWDKGFWPRFGLVEVDYKTLERKIRPSAREYAKICERNAIGA